MEPVVVLPVAEYERLTGIEASILEGDCGEAYAKARRAVLGEVKS
jgi:hypothetical protein